MKKIFLILITAVSILSLCSCKNDKPELFDENVEIRAFINYEGGNYKGKSRALHILNATEECDADYHPAFSECNSHKQIDYLLDAMGKTYRELEDNYGQLDLVREFGDTTIYTANYHKFVKPVYGGTAFVVKDGKVKIYPFSEQLGENCSDILIKDNMLYLIGSLEKDGCNIAKIDLTNDKTEYLKLAFPDVNVKLISNSELNQITDDTFIISGQFIFDKTPKEYVFFYDLKTKETKYLEFDYKKENLERVIATDDGYIIITASCNYEEIVEFKASIYYYDKNLNLKNSKTIGDIKEFKNPVYNVPGFGGDINIHNNILYACVYAVKNPEKSTAKETAVLQYDLSSGKYIINKYGGIAEHFNVLEIKDGKYYEIN